MIILAIIVFIIIIGLLIFAHEFGHFITAKIMGVKVEEFGFGFPPRIFGIKKGETIYSLNWIPIGGFVKMLGQSDFDSKDHLETKKDPRSFLSRKVWQRAIILASGVGMNFLLAAIIISIGFMIGLPSAIGEDIPAHAKVKDQKIQILMVEKDSPAENVGLKSGDAISSIDGIRFNTADQMRNYIIQNPGKNILVDVQRGSETEDLDVKLRDSFPEGQGPLGVSFAETGLVSFPWYLAIYNGFKATGELTVQIIIAFGKLIGGLVSTGKVAGAVAGPVGIAVLTSQATKLGFAYILQFTALLSINLAIINILPFPALDGGHLFFLVIEKVRGGKGKKAIKIENFIHLIGFVVLIGLVILVTYRDIAKFWGKIVGFFS